MNDYEKFFNELYDKMIIRGLIDNNPKTEKEKLEIIRSYLNDQISGNSINDGIWIKYTKGEEHLLYHLLKDMQTNWWIGDSYRDSKAQLEQGDCYIYYTKDSNREYKVPRLAICMEGNKIKKIRGIAYGKNIEAELEDILEQKLEEFSDKDIWKKKLSDVKRLTMIYNKNKDNQELTKEDLRFLYEIDGPMVHLGQGKDIRIEEIISTRDIRKDLSYLFDCKESEIALNQEELLANPEQIVVLWNNLTVFSESVNFPKLKYIRGYADLGDLKSAKGLSSLRTVYMGANFDSLESAEGLSSLQTIGGSAFFRKLKSAKGLSSLERIGEDANFESLESAEGLESLQIVGEDANFYRLRSAKGLSSLKRIGKDASFDNLRSAEGLSSLERIGGDAKFYRLKNAKGLNNLQVIYGNAYFKDLESAEGFENLQTIYGYADFRRLKSAKGLSSLERIGGDAYFDRLESAKDFRSLQTIGGDAIFESLESAEGFENLQTIGGDGFMSSF